MGAALKTNRSLYSLIFLAAFLGSASYLGSQPAAGDHCPEGKAWTGRTCVWKNLCVNGEPLRPGGTCDALSEPVSEPPQVVEKPGKEIEKRLPGAEFDTAECSSEVWFHKPDENPKERNSLFVGGELKALFLLYLNRAKAAGLKIDLSRLSVRFMDEASGRLDVLRGDVDVKLSFGERLAGRNFREKWLEVLGSRVASPVKGARAIADREGIDFVCGQV